MDQTLREKLFDAMIDTTKPKPGEPPQAIHVEFAEMTAQEIDRIAPVIDEFIKTVLANARNTFKTALEVCIEQRGHHAFIDEYLPDGIFWKDTEAKIKQKGETK